MSRNEIVHFIAQFVNYALLVLLADYLVPTKGIKWAGVYALLIVPSIVTNLFSKVRP